MCCGFAFWKRVVVFGLTFGLGVVVSGSFISNKECTAEKLPPSVKPIIISAPENKNCVPLDENLKFEKSPLIEKDPSRVENEKPAPRPRKSDKKIAKEERETIAEPHLYNPSKDTAEYKNLLHREKCFESRDQK